MSKRESLKSKLHPKYQPEDYVRQRSLNIRMYAPQNSLIIKATEEGSSNVLIHRDQNDQR
ncbi:hypothetical protein Csa_008058 [Cucumis sativus]|uniref:Uncharacterized protein n=1 Tax=Cucumis sativus TaxID=3659 RepID=A0A0A0KU58_CUCSA|nr:hypothetical protein Csa_008058 [Cucumis sativus]